MTITVAGLEFGSKNSHQRKLAAHYCQTRASLHTPASPQSRNGLDWMNFFPADVQTGFGTFVAFYLAHLGWSKRSVGFVPTIGGLAPFFPATTCHSTLIFASLMIGHHLFASAFSKAAKAAGF